MENHPPFDEDIDRKALRALRERFLTLNRARIDALRARLTHHQRLCVDALPVLLHSNHAALPGFVDFDVAAGIDGYTPDRHAIDTVRTFALSYTYERFVERRRDVRALYLTVPTRSGDAVAFTLTVCCAGALHDRLAEKLAGIARFAAAHAIELTPELVDAESHAFRTQNRTPCLARDAFYRSAILLAGRYPIWWLVPPELEDRHAEYCARLKAQRFVGRDETIDLGAAERIPHAECIEAGVTALARALDAPYAHLHTTMLLEAYAAGATEPLARRYKQRVWNGTALADDASLAQDLVALHLERVGAGERLELSRHCLFASTLDPARQRELAAAWNWTDSQVRRARSDRELTIVELDAENRRVNGELAFQYMRLQDARDALEPASRARLDALGRRIDRLVRRPFGALTRVNAALMPGRIVGTLRLERSDGQWRALDGRHVAFGAARLAAVMAWAHLNCVTLDNLRVPDANRRSACGRMLDLLARLSAKHDAYRVWIINAQDSATALQASGDAIISDWDDALDFSGFHANLVAGIDVLDVGTDGIAARHYVGDAGLVDALVDAATEPAVAPHVGCVAGGHERLIEDRLDTLVDAIRDAFANPTRRVRFIVGLGDGFACVERDPRGLHGRVVDSETALSSLLAKAPPHGQTLIVDSRSPRLAALRQLCAWRASDTAERDRILVHDQRGVIRVLVMSRDGAIERVAVPELPLLDIADSIAAYLAATTPASAAKHARSARLAIARGDTPPVSVASANVADGRYVTSVAADVERRGLAFALREKFAIERDSARGFSTA